MQYLSFLFIFLVQLLNWCTKNLRILKFKCLIIIIIIKKKTKINLCVPDRTVEKKNGACIPVGYYVVSHCPATNELGSRLCTKKSKKKKNTSSDRIALLEQRHNNLKSQNYPCPTSISFYFTFRRKVIERI